MFPSVLIALALSASAFATIYTTSPVASTVFAADQEATISWQDDGSAPSLKEFGPAKISIYVGNAKQQTSLQVIEASLDVSTVQSLKFTPKADIGPSGSEYFIRFESLGAKDASAPQYPALAFSAKFTMTGGTGTFPKDVQAQIDGQSTAPLASQSTAAVSSTGSSSSPASATVTGSAKSLAVSATKSGSSPSASASGNSAAGLGVSNMFLASAAAVAAIAMF